MYAIILHAHQKVDRVAHRHLRRLIGATPAFPPLDGILHFEGVNGPDSPKLKNKQSVTPPWHFVDPFNIADTELSKLISYHYDELVKALKEKNTVRAGFEAAWMAHALVDGLTPPHHYPYEEKLEELRGESRTSRKTAISHFVVKGDNRRDSVSRSLKLIGPKGLLTTHTTFEAGAYMIMQSMKYNRAFPGEDELKAVRELGLVEYFQRIAREVGAWDMYRKFYENGWTPKLARTVRRELVPRMVRMVTLAWYSAALDAGLIEEKK